MEEVPGDVLYGVLITKEFGPENVQNMSERYYPNKSVSSSSSSSSSALPSNSSTQMQWNEPALNAIVMRAVNYLGVNLEDALAIQYSEGKIQQGT